VGTGQPECPPWSALGEGQVNLQFVGLIPREGGNWGFGRRVGKGEGRMIRGGKK